MYYILEHDSEGDNNFFKGYAEEFDGFLDVKWNMGEEIKDKVPSILLYKTDQINCSPEDYPRIMSPQKLLSPKAVNIFKNNNILGIEFIKSEIHSPEKKYDYYTINVTAMPDCIDWEKSKYQMVQYGPVSMPKFDKLVLIKKKISKDTKIFTLNKGPAIILVHQIIKDEFEKQNITGVNFVPVNEYQDI